MSENIIKDNIEFKFSKNLVKYEDALKFMEERSQEIILGKKKEMIWVLEHEPVYTAGISAKESDMLIKNNVPIFKVNRGGKYTYHCPGMKIIYVMLNLKRFFEPNRPDVSKFVEFLENWVIEILSFYGIKGEIKKGRVGIWVENNNIEEKVAAIGIKLKKWVSYHGIAINVNPDLSGFKNIVPCGISEFGVTSMKKILDKDIVDFDEKIIEKFFETYLQIAK